MELTNITTKYVCPIDLHSKKMYVTIMEKDGKILYHKNLKNSFEILKKEVAEYLHDMTIGVESTYNYYWLLDGALKEGIPFLLGHALYLKAIRGKKHKNDRLDSKAIGDLMRANYFPIGYPYPPEKRALRDLFRRRLKYVKTRAGLYTHINLLHSQQGLIEVKSEEIKAKSKRRLLLKNFSDNEIRLSLRTCLNLIDAYDKEISNIEKRIFEVVKLKEEENFQILMSFPGIGEIIALTIIYEIDRIERFESPQKFSSYSRVVKPQRESSVKKTDDKNKKIGNPYLKCAFSQAAIYSRNHSVAIRQFYEKLVKTKGKTKANSIMRHKIATAVYYMLKSKELFNEKKFLQSGMKG